MYSDIQKADPENGDWVHIPISLLSKLDGLEIISEFSFFTMLRNYGTRFFTNILQRCCCILQQGIYDL